MIFDGSKVPSGLINSAQLDYLNRVFTKVADLRTKEVRFGEPPSGFNVSDKFRVHGQAHIWRCLELCQEAENLRRKQSGLAAVILLRSHYETVASYWHFSQKLKKSLSSLSTAADLSRLDELVRGAAFSTRRNPLLHLASEDQVQLDTVNILTKIQKLDTEVVGFRDDYEYLCEFVHPNSFGTVGWFSEANSSEGVVRFSRQKNDYELEIFRLCCNAVELLKYLESAVLSVEKELPAISDLGHQLAIVRPQN